MNIFELVILSIGLAMDAFAVSICKGLAMPDKAKKNSIIVGLWFGGFQALMPTIGYFLGIRFSFLVKTIDHWIAFFLLSYIAYKMFKEAKSGCDINSAASTDIKTMFMLSVATSIDALVVGITFAFLHVNIFNAALSIGVITFAISSIGVLAGRKFGTRIKEKAGLLGSFILFFMAFRILITHLIEHYL